MNLSQFKNSQESHNHSLQTLNVFYEHDDFMESVGRVVDLGCGLDALDLQWWARATTRDDSPIPLNINCTGVDQLDRICDPARKAGIAYTRLDIESWQSTKRQYDVLWCHDVFQYMINPMQCLRHWWNITALDGMLVLIFPQATNMHFNTQAYDLPTGWYYNHTLVSIIQMLAVNGWDCRNGFFKKLPGDPWIHAVVYKSSHAPMDPKTTNWYRLAELGLLPTSAVDSLNRHGIVRQRDLVLPWLDKSVASMAQQ